jgi:hypothetical protein
MPPAAGETPWLRHREPEDMRADPASSGKIRLLIRACRSGEQYGADYPKMIYFSKLGKGGHFAAWEQPELFVQEQRAAFRTLR